MSEGGIESAKMRRCDFWETEERTRIVRIVRMIADKREVKTKVRRHENTKTRGQHENTRAREREGMGDRLQD